MTDNKSDIKLMELIKIQPFTICCSLILTGFLFQCLCLSSISVTLSLCLALFLLKYLYLAVYKIYFTLSLILTHSVSYSILCCGTNSISLSIALLSLYFSSISPLLSFHLSSCISFCLLFNHLLCL